MGDMFWRRIYEILREVPSVFSIVDDILIVGYDQDGTDQDTTVHRVLHICRKENLKIY